MVKQLFESAQEIVMIGTCLSAYQSIIIWIRDWLSCIWCVSCWGSYCLGFSWVSVSYLSLQILLERQIFRWRFSRYTYDPSLLWESCLVCRWQFNSLYPDFIGIYSLPQFVICILTPRPYWTSSISLLSSPTEDCLVSSSEWDSCIFHWDQCIIQILLVCRL